jgi:glycosyltransferase involved in cell wall biosynthesis
MMQKNVASLHRRVTIAALESLLNYCKRNGNTQQSVEKRLLYVPASVLPYHISGYTTRTHEVIRALGKADLDVRVVSRPGYPWDRSDRVQHTDAATTLVDGIKYEHVRSPSKHRPLLMFAVQAARAIEKVAVREKVSVIHAASNHENALPALLAAKKLGISFQYEMRGLWELTRASRIPGYEDSSGFLRGLELEGFVAKNADRVLVISEQLGKFAQQRWNIPADRFNLLPNCVEPTRFTLSKPQDVKPMTIGYAGSLMSYEGLDTLIDAVDLLFKRGVKVYVDIVGDGEVRAQLEEQVRSLNLSDRIRFVGRVTPDEARTIIGSCTLVCLPRKPYKVCEIVPPIKLVEALAMGKPVVVPDLPVFRDEMGESNAGWFFKAGDTADLASVIETALGDHETLFACSVRAREYTETTRCWQDFVGNVVDGE